MQKTEIKMTMVTNKDGKSIPVYKFYRDGKEYDLKTEFIKAFQNCMNCLGLCGETPKKNMTDVTDGYHKPKEDTTSASGKLHSKATTRRTSSPIIRRKKPRDK